MQMKEYKLALELFEVISDSQENCNESVFLSSAICHSSLGNLSAALIQVSPLLCRLAKPFFGTPKASRATSSRPNFFIRVAHTKRHYRPIVNCQD